MEAFAKAADYKALHDTDLSDARLGALLGRASRDIAAELRASGIDYSEPNDDFAADLADVAISMVHRAIGEDSAGADIPFGANQFSETAGSYSASATLANPYGDMFMTKAERRKLGIGRARAGFSFPY